MVERIRALHAEGAVLYAWSSGQIAGGPTDRPAQRQKKFQRYRTRALELAARASPVPLEEDGGWPLSVRMRDVGARAWAQTLDGLEARASRSGVVRVEVEGYVPLAAAAYRQVLPDLATTTISTAIACLVVVGLALRSWALAGQVAVPLAMTAATVLAGLATLGMPLSHLNLFLLSLSLGTGIDGWIHLAWSGRDRSRSDALREVFPALLCTTMLVSAGFLALLASSTPTMRGIGAALAVATVANVVWIVEWWLLTAPSGRPTP